MCKQTTVNRTTALQSNVRSADVLHRDASAFSLGLCNIDLGRVSPRALGHTVALWHTDGLPMGPSDYLRHLFQFYVTLQSSLCVTYCMIHSQAVYRRNNASFFMFSISTTYITVQKLTYCITRFIAQTPYSVRWWKIQRDCPNFKQKKCHELEIRICDTAQIFNVDFLFHAHRQASVCSEAFLRRHDWRAAERTLFTYRTKAHWHFCSLLSGVAYMVLTVLGPDSLLESLEVTTAGNTYTTPSKVKNEDFSLQNNI